MFDGIDFNKIGTSITSISEESIRALYGIVNNYMKSNYLKDNDEDEYYIRVNGELFIIGYTYVYDGFYYLRRCSEEEKNVKSYDLNDILNNRITDKERITKEKLDLVNGQINELIEEGVPLRLIRRSINIDD